MLVTEFYKGQGLGNQLACYVTTRVIALDRGFEFGVMHPERFKGADFMSLDYGKAVRGGRGPEGGPPTELPEGIQRYIRECPKVHPSTGADIRDYDHSLREISDNTKIDGLLQGEKYFAHRKSEVAAWLRVEADEEILKLCTSDTCIINFRGGEYVRVKYFFLPQKYWQNAVRCMLDINPKMRFVVITDDVSQARGFFPDYRVFHFSIAGDYSAINSATYLILSNSSFAWFPAWLNENLKFCIAPKYWGAHNISDGYWSLTSNLTDGWNYLDRHGTLSTYEMCKRELDSYAVPITIQDRYVQLEGNPRRADLYSKVRAVIRKSMPSVVMQIYRKTINSRRHVANYFLHKLAMRKYVKESRQIVPTTPIAYPLLKAKVYDVFYFLNELDLLEIRLNILDEHVDFFVIVEGAYTFSGKPNASCFKENFERFAKWHHKCIHLWVADFHSDAELLQMAKSHPNVGDGQDYWVREFYFKECAKNALVNLRDEDIVFISDVDEIWNPLKKEALQDFSESPINRPIQLSYYYYLDYRSNEHRSGWTGTIACNYGYLRNKCLNDLRSRATTPAREINQGGWHFSYMGGALGAMHKLLAWDHPEYNVHLAEMVGRIESGGDYAGRQIRYWIDESELPKYILENRDKWINLFKSNHV